MKLKNNVYNEIFDKTPILIAVCDFDSGEFIEVNDQFCETVGYKREDVIGHTPSELNLFVDEEKFQEAQEKLCNSGKMKDYKFFIRSARGEILCGIFSGWIFDEGSEKYSVMTMSDVLKYSDSIQMKEVKKVLEHQNKMIKKEKESLKISEHRNRAILDVLPDMLFVYDKNGMFIDCQGNEEDNLLLKKKDFIGRHMTDIMPSDISKQALECIGKTLKSGNVESFEYQLDFDKEVKYFETRMVKSGPDEVLAIVRNITVRQKEQQLIMDLIYKDPLTGVHNRRYFDEFLDKIDREQFLPTSMFMIDVNGLKLANDAFGHLLGDKLLKLVSASIKNMIPEKAMLSRIGGDEFVIVLPNFTVQESLFMRNRLYKEINSLKCEEAVVSVSIGFEVREKIERTLREVFVEAENHMFRRKLLETQSMRYQTVLAILNSLKEKNEREKRHSDQVSQLSKKIAIKLGYTEHDAKEVEMAGLLHDIGKIAVREEVLNKPGKLTEEEYNEIKRHSESGYHILKTVDEYSALAESILSHHERMDGKGYPRGLKGEEIPEIARIISVADAYEAMISDRSYREGTTREKAIGELRRCSNCQFDEKVVEAFVQIFD